MIKVLLVAAIYRGAWMASVVKVNEPNQLLRVVISGIKVPKEKVSSAANLASKAKSCLNDLIDADINKDIQTITLGRTAPTPKTAAPLDTQDTDVFESSATKRKARRQLMAQMKKKRKQEEMKRKEEQQRKKRLNKRGRGGASNTVNLLDDNDNIPGDYNGESVDSGGVDGNNEYNDDASGDKQENDGTGAAQTNAGAAQTNADKLRMEIESLKQRLDQERAEQKRQAQERAEQKRHQERQAEQTRLAEQKRLVAERKRQAQEKQLLEAARAAALSHTTPTDTDIQPQHAKPFSSPTLTERSGTSFATSYGLSPSGRISFQTPQRGQEQQASLLMTSPQQGRGIGMLSPTSMTSPQQGRGIGPSGAAFQRGQQQQASPLMTSPQQGRGIGMLSPPSNRSMSMTPSGAAFQWDQQQQNYLIFLEEQKSRNKLMRQSIKLAKLESWRLFTQQQKEKEREKKLEEFFDTHGDYYY